MINSILYFRSTPLFDDLRKKSLIITIFFSFLFAFSLSSSGKDDSYPNTENQSALNEYVTYFKELPPEEQANELLKTLKETDQHLQLEPPELAIQTEIIMKETGLDVIPYLREIFDDMKFEYSKKNDKIEFSSKV